MNSSSDGKKIQIKTGKVRIKEGEKDKNKYLAHPSSSGKKQQRKEDLYRNGDDLWKKERKNPSMLNNPRVGKGRSIRRRENEQRQKLNNVVEL